jgi:hypothetical protein
VHGDRDRRPKFVPTHVVRMLKLPEEQRRAFDLT